VIIAHRLSTIRNSDLILLLEGGKVVEQGTHDDLMKHGQKYASLLASQGDRFSGAAIASSVDSAADTAPLLIDNYRLP
jgi:ABC-type protease/lipase transport system fused ATPase/permease subunit